MVSDSLIGFSGLIKGRLVTRYKRFFADIELDTGETITAHCPNPGKMPGLLDSGTPALVTHFNDPKRKLQYRLEALEENGIWVGVNTQWPNRLIHKAIAQDLLPELTGYGAIQLEKKYGHNSRIDLYASGHTFFADAYIEIKNVHFSRQKGLAEFPDCVTERGAKHLYELIEMVRVGYRAVVVFCVQRDDCQRFDIARDCDPGFGRAYDAAREAGVEFIAVSFGFSMEGLRLAHVLEIA
ncbi:DNA/RNA nuclease SfsA [Asticcacaulis sp.]|uniref:DNA/RNA nuclease SfsA n=1 Tax=Asticcacaulis sp. TaxID=1872648 RepID=UPI002C7AEC16|nr:DNA/RNA nuclease SfsA [Asticcacaulis sp.]HTM81483.1 DNA/RNA nuclease SfsA [Asticcacaulis sp.]